MIGGTKAPRQHSDAVTCHYPIARQAVRLEPWRRTRGLRLCTQCLHLNIRVRVRVIENGECYFVDDERVQSTDLSEVLVQGTSFALKAHQGMRLRCDISFSQTWIIADFRHVLNPSTDRVLRILMECELSGPKWDIAQYGVIMTCNCAICLEKVFPFRDL